MSDKADWLQQAAARHVLADENILHQQIEGDTYIGITDRRIVIVKVGSLMGERSQSIPLGAITEVSTTVKDGKVVLLQFAVPGRSFGEAYLSGENLTGAMHALIAALPSHGGGR